MQKNVLNYCDSFDAQGEETEGQKQKITCVSEY